MVLPSRFTHYYILLPGLFLLAAGCGRLPSDTEVVVFPSPSPALTKMAVESTTEVMIPTQGAAVDQYEKDRNKMVDQTIANRGVSDENVLRAMRVVPRHEFVPEDYLRQAYNDHPLPIGYGQTISQPYIVAWMTELLGLESGDKVLEIGTGSGYQAAVLAELGDVDVYSIEIVPELAALAEQRLRDLGYAVRVKQGNGYFGWEEHAPYDAIIVTAAPDHLPQTLVQQLVERGVLVIPIGPPGGYQSLWQFEKTGETVQARNLGGVLFVPFTGGGVGESAP